MTFPIVRNEHRNNILHMTIAPAEVDETVAKEAHELALRLAKGFELAGILAIELFITKDNKVIVNELAPRPHNSGRDHRGLLVRPTRAHSRHCRLAARTAAAAQPFNVRQHVAPTRALIADHPGNVHDSWERTPSTAAIAPCEGLKCSSRPRAITIGADAAFETGARLPHKVDAVIESVGAATWSHSVKSVRPGGTIAICGATTGDQPGAELTRIFFQDIRVQGNTMGSRDDFARLLKFVEHADLHPVIDSTYALADAPAAFRKVVDGDVFGKVVLHIEPSK